MSTYAYILTLVALSPSKLLPSVAKYMSIDERTIMTSAVHAAIMVTTMNSTIYNIITIKSIRPLMIL